MYDIFGKFKDENVLYKKLIGIGKIDNEFEIEPFLKLSEMTLDNVVKEFDCKELLRNYYRLM